MTSDRYLKAAINERGNFVKKSLSFKIGIGITLFFVVIIAISLFWTPYDPNGMNVLEKFHSPSLRHLMGTDNFGRDILSRVMDGLRTTFIVAISTVGIGVVCGTLVGAFTGYFGGWLDEILMRINDAITAFPSILLALVIISVLESRKYNVIIALGIAFIPSFARVIRSEFISYKHRDFVKSAKLMGASGIRIMFMHILPNVMPTILAAMVIGFNNAVLAESSMSYLGVGVQPPDASLGRMLSEAQGYLLSAPWYGVFPAIVVILLVIGFVLLGNGLVSRSFMKQSINSDKDEIDEIAIKAQPKVQKCSDAILTVEDLEIGFHQNIVVNHVNFQLEREEIIGIVGESGSGKTMTALSIAGLLPESAYCEGKIIYKNANIIELSKAEKRRYQGKEIAMIFQEPMTSLNPVIKIGKQVEEMLKLHTTLGKRERREKVLEALEMVELSEPKQLYHKYPHQLSGGMQQRVMIAIAMICEPDILIADEPTTALDAHIQDQILELLIKLNKEKKTAIIFISHNLEVIRRISNRVIVLNQGYMIEQGTAENIFYHPQNEYTKRLIGSMTTGKKDFHNLSSNKIVELKNVSIFYKKNNQKNYVVKNMDLEIKEGEILGLVGPSGGGKTTLAKTILGIHKDYEGQISHYSSMPQMIFQDPYSSLNPAKTIGWILEEPLKIQKKHENHNDIKEKVIKMLKEVGLTEMFYYRYPSQLSGGQRQRISIAGALMLGSKFIVADEPVSALDATIGAQVLELLLKLQKERGLSILFISHDSSVIEKVSDRILVLE